MSSASSKSDQSTSQSEDELDEDLPTKPEAKKSEALWMMTFADLSFILMCFFALLLSMSSINTKKYDNIVDGIKKDKTENKRNLEAIKRFIEKEIKKNKLEKKASVKLDADGLAVEFSDRLLFRSGSAKASKTFSKVSSKVLGIIAKSDKKYSISIEGHTDDTPLGRYNPHKSNWELSSARGISLLQLLHKKGVKKDRVRVISYADTKPKIPIKNLRGKKLTLARAKNRRVVVRLQ